MFLDINLLTEDKDNDSLLFNIDRAVEKKKIQNKNFAMREIP